MRGNLDRLLCPRRLLRPWERQETAGQGNTVTLKTGGRLNLHAAVTQSCGMSVHICVTPAEQMRKAVCRILPMRPVTSRFCLNRRRAKRGNMNRCADEHAEQVALCDW